MTFLPGQSGNPNGRPKEPIAATKLRRAISDSMPEIIDMLIEQARSGDVAAAKLLLDRVVAPLKPQTPSVRLPIAETLTAQGQEILRAIFTGQVSPDIGARLIQALADQSRIAEIDELTRRASRSLNMTVRTLQKRLAAIESRSREHRPVIVIIEPHESKDEALQRHEKDTGCAYGQRMIFVRVCDSRREKSIEV